ncbi:MAG: gliding motility protein GldM [Sphingobacteriales bacterium]|nr:gliding motility protein GldM [Sphingobacteriales bacterium]MBI3720171.1 gliding motility protein GldM [Sphingobacteriales bacterium]
MALPKEPRQKMINMMYLVLTALLALNVSAEIINAFKTVNNSLQIANGVATEKNNLIYKSFQDKLSDPLSAERARIWKPKADSVKILADAMNSYLNQLKQDLKTEAGLKIENGEEEFKFDNLEAATRLMDNKGKGKELLNKLTQFKSDIFKLLPDDSARKEFSKTLPLNLEPPKVENKGNKDWTSAYFRMTPAIAAVTILSKFQNDVKNSESQLVDYFHKKVGEVKVVYNQFEPLIGTSATYLMPGQELQVNAGLGAYSKDVVPDIFVNGSKVPVEGGLGSWKTTVGGPGTGTVKVAVKYKDPIDGKEKTVEKEINYTVGSPTGAFVSAEKVKVLYIDLPNELAVTGGNVGDEKVSVSIDNGSLNKTGPGRYIASPSTPGKAIVTVNADGKVSKFEFRVKTVPDPVAMVGRNKGGVIGAAEFKAQAGVRAELENFVFEGVNFTVNAYTLICVGGQNFKEAPGIRPSVPGNLFDPVRDVINKCTPGTTVVIDEIYATGPGGRRKLPPIVFNLR